MKAAEYLDFPIGEKWPKRCADHRSEVAALSLISSRFFLDSCRSLSRRRRRLWGLYAIEERDRMREKDGFGSIFSCSRPPDWQIFIQNPISPPQPTTIDHEIHFIKERRPTRAEGCFYLRVTP